MLKPCRSLLLNIPGIAEMNGLSIGYLRANSCGKAAPSGVACAVMLRAAPFPYNVSLLFAPQGCTREKQLLESLLRILD
jgi:hypothetical protein